MPDPIQLAVNRTKMFIPETLLERAFAQNDGYGVTTPYQVGLVNEIVQKQVLPDCNLHGGNVKHIVLDSLWTEDTELRSQGSEAEIVYRIPPEYREESDITGIIAVSPPTQYAVDISDNGSSFTDTGYGTVNTAASELLSSYVGSGRVSPPKATLLSRDLVKLSPAGGGTQWVLTVRLEYSSTLANMHASSIEAFCRLVVSATKAYIYNRFVLLPAQLSSDTGALADKLQEIVESYEPEIDSYYEQIIKFSGGAKMDPGRLEFFIVNML